MAPLPFLWGEGLRWEFSEMLLLLSSCGLFGGLGGISLELSREEVAGTPRPRAPLAPGAPLGSDELQAELWADAPTLWPSSSCWGPDQADL